jgi:hypothetical protein
MSSIPVAAQPGSAMPRVRAFVAVALLLVIGVGVGVGARAIATTAPAVAETTTPVKHHAGWPATRVAPAAVAPMTSYRQLVANLAAAEARHDYAAQARFQGQLDEALTPALIGKIYQERERLMAALAAADRDSHAALITRELRDLCGATAVKAELEFCN